MWGCRAQADSLSSQAGGGAPGAEAEEQRVELGREERQIAEEETAAGVEEVGRGSSGEEPAAESDQSQAAGPKVGGGEPGAMGSVAARDKEDEMEYDTDCVSVADSQAYSGDLYAGGNKWLPK